MDAERYWKALDARIAALTESANKAERARASGGHILALRNQVTGLQMARNILFEQLRNP